MSRTTPSPSPRNSNSRTAIRPCSARRTAPTQSNSPPRKCAIQRYRPSIRWSPIQPHPATILATLGRHRRRGRRSPADRSVTRRTALRWHPPRLRRVATTAEHQSFATDEHDAYPDRSLSHSPFSDPRVNCWYPKLTLWSRARSELIWRFRKRSSPPRLCTITPLAALGGGVTDGGMNLG